MIPAPTRCMNSNGEQHLSGSFQIIRFGVIGVVSNGALYVLYLLLAHLAFPVLVAMTLTFAAGVVLSWLLNGLITFRARLTRRSGMRMIMVYAGAYVTNLALLWLAVQVWSMPHQVVQLAIMAMLAVALFFLQKYWVFPRDS